MLKPRFVFASGVYAPASGGSEISAHTMMSELTARGYRTVVLTGATVNASLGDEIRDRVHVRRIPESDLTAALEQETRAAKGACIVLTQLMWGEIVMRWSRQNKVPCVYFARSRGVGLDLSAEGPCAPTLIISNSATTREYIEARTGRVSPVVPPLVRLSDYLVRGRAEFDAGPAPEAITMFNPIVEKGGAIFKSIAELLPIRHFVAVRGWQHWKRVDGSWISISCVLPPEGTGLRMCKSRKKCSLTTSRTSQCFRLCTTFAQSTHKRGFCLFLHSGRNRSDA